MLDARRTEEVFHALLLELDCDGLDLIGRTDATSDAITESRSASGYSATTSSRCHFNFFDNLLRSLFRNGLTTSEPLTTSLPERAPAKAGRRRSRSCGQADLRHATPTDVAILPRSLLLFFRLKGCLEPFEAVLETSLELLLLGLFQSQTLPDPGGQARGRLVILVVFLVQDGNGVGRAVPAVVAKQGLQWQVVIVSRPFVGSRTWVGAGFKTKARPLRDMLHAALESNYRSGNDIVLKDFGGALDNLGILASIQVSTKHPCSMHGCDSIRNQGSSRSRHQANLRL